MSKSYFIRGTANYAKILGTAPPGYDNGPAEWTFDLILDEDGLAEYKKSGADTFYVKTDVNTGNQFIKFKRRAQRKDGSDSTPISVVGPDGQPWDQTKLIGNGSVLNVKFALQEATHKKVTRLKPSVIAVQVWEHVPYTGKGFPTKTTVSEDWSEEATA